MLVSCVLALRKDAMRIKITKIRNTPLHWDKYLVTFILQFSLPNLNFWLLIYL